MRSLLSHRVDIGREAGARSEREPGSDDGLRLGLDHLLSLQRPDGRWEGEMVWNTMVTSQYVLVRRITGRWPLEEEATRRAIRHFSLTRRDDGSWPCIERAPDTSSSPPSPTLPCGSSASTPATRWWLPRVHGSGRSPAGC
jgi:hypothetical protein